MTKTMMIDGVTVTVTRPDLTEPERKRAEAVVLAALEQIGRRQDATAQPA